MEASVDTLCLLTLPKEGQQQIEKQKQPEVTENRTVQKSDNQGVKEETFIQTSSKGRDGQPGGEDLQQGSSWRTGQSHICVQINWE